MSNVKNIKRDFLYYKMPEVWVLGEGFRSDYLSKFGYEMEDFENFIKKCSVTEFIELMVLAYNKTYPNFSKFEVVLAKEYKDVDDVYYSEGIFNKYVKSIQWASEDIIQFDKFKSSDVEGYYIRKIDIEFKTPQNISELIQAISNGLEDKTFTNTNGKFVVEDSVITEMVITETTFSLKINREKVIYYGMVY